MKFFIHLLITLFGVKASLQEGCLIDITKFHIDDYGPTQPLVLSNTTYEFLYPPLANKLNNLSIPLDVGQTILISCPGGKLWVGVNDLPVRTIAFATCNQDSQIEVDGEIIDFYNIKCRVDHVESIKYDEQNRCLGDGDLIEIGYEIGVDDVFVNLVNVCFDNTTKSNLYSQYTVTKYSEFQHGTVIAAPPIQDDEFYDLPNVDLFYVYSVDTVRETFNSLLGLPIGSETYINITGTNASFICSETVADSDDFLYNKQQLSVFRYIDVYPLWCGLINPSFLQSDLSKFAYNHQLDLEIYSGSSGILKYPHEETKDPVEIFLYKDDVHGSIIPVPEIIWKVAYDSESKRAITFVTVNNIYANDNDIVKICQDIQDDVDWLTWSNDRVDWGYSYACSYDDLKSVIALPELDVTGILK